VPSRKPLVVALFNTSSDLVDLKNFLAHHDPDVVLYDIAPPYDANWMLFKHIRSLDDMRDRKIVLTSMNKKHVEKLAGRDQPAVKDAARERPVS
jgi:CheY-like chemotaxis protein